jgi:hypothetical protein
MHVRAIVAAVLGAVAVTCAAGNPTYSIDAHIISTGTSVHATSVCFGLDAVIAEPVAGFSSGRFYITHSIYDIVCDGELGRWHVLGRIVRRLVSAVLNNNDWANGFVQVLN